MIEYREAYSSELKEIAKMVAVSFGEYPMYTLTFRDKFKTKEDFISYITKLNKVHISANARKHKCFVGVKDGKIVSVALLQNPNIKRISLWNYIVSGGISLLFPIGFKRLIDFFNISNIAHKAYEEKHKNAWYIELLAVNPNYKGQGLGSKMINDCLIPYCKAQGASELALITNTQGNYKFYEKNGFTNFAYDKLNWKDKYIDNFSFVKNI